LAEKERRLIGERTKAALQNKIAQGWQAGNPYLDEHRWKSSRTNLDKADDFARKVLSTIQRMVIDGMNQLAIACELNAIAMPTARGGAWTSASVGNVLRRQVQVPQWGSPAQRLASSRSKVLSSSMMRAAKVIWRRSSASDTRRATTALAAAPAVTWRVLERMWWRPLPCGAVVQPQ
jgi:hypothetical protein